MAMLMFRVGRADETLPTGGLTHLVEHMALFPLGKRAYEYNGRVEETITGFYARGTLAEMTGFLGQVGDALSDLPVDRIETEKRILSTEALGREPGMVERLIGLRFGPNYYGTMMTEEFGLGWLRAEDATAWAQSRFTLDNAILWMTAEPPADLAIRLPRGDRQPPPPVAPIESLRLPACLQQGRGGVALGVLTERSSAVHAGFLIGLERARDRLRIDAGLSYAVSGSYVPLDGVRVHITAGADCMDREAATVRDHLLATFDELASEGPTEDELAWDRAQVRRAFEEPTAVLGTLDSTARDILAGVEPTSAREIVQEREELTPAAVAEAMATALESLIVMVPSGVAGGGDRLADYDTIDRQVVSGPRHPPTEDARAAGETSELFAGADGITHLVPANDHVVTLRWENCAAAIPGLSGSVLLIARHNTSATVYPYRYERGDDVLAAITSGVPRERWVPMTDRERALQPIVQGELGRPELAHLDREVDALAHLLTWDEQLVHLAEARQGKVRGLLVLTDARVIFLFFGATDTLVEKRLADLAPPQVKGTFKKRLTIADSENELELGEINPPGRLAAIVDRLREATGG